MYRLSRRFVTGAAYRPNAVFVRLICVPLLLASAGANSGTSSSQVPRQPTRAVLLANPEELSVSDYGWLSRNTLVVSSTSPTTGRWQVVQLDARTRKLTPLAATVSEHQPYPLRPSPDGRKLLIEVRVNQGVWIVAGLDGHVFAERNAAGASWPSQACWLPDGSGWAQMITAGGPMTIHLFEAGSVASGKAYELPRYPWLVGFLDNRHLLVSDYSLAATSIPDHCTLTVYELGVRALMHHTVSFGVPNSWIRAVSISPDCRRLCWLVLTPTNPAHPEMAACVATFYVTNVDGSGKTPVYDIGLPGVQVDSLSLTSDHTDGPADVPTKPKWSFEGRRISYLLDHKLWAFDVPDGAGRKTASNRPHR